MAHSCSSMLANGYVFACCSAITAEIVMTWTCDKYVERRLHGLRILSWIRCLIVYNKLFIISMSLFFSPKLIHTDSQKHLSVFIHGIVHQVWLQLIWAITNQTLHLFVRYRFLLINNPLAVLLYTATYDWCWQHTGQYLSHEPRSVFWYPSCTLQNSCRPC
jgi:hypothetical protein